MEQVETKEPAERKERVREFFEQPQVYLTYDYNLKIRMETVQTMIGDLKVKSVLDAPCGTGDISIPLLDRFEKLTCIDFSESMVAHARDQVPEGRKQDVRFITGDITEWNEKETYDLVICLGVLAHAEEPEQMLKHIMQKVSPGGYLILQNTDGSHPYSYLIRAYLGLKRLAGKSTYNVKWNSHRSILGLVKSYGFMPRMQWRYNQSWLGFSHLFDNKKKYSATRAWFGEVSSPKLQFLGSDVIYMFKRL